MPLASLRRAEARSFVDAQLERVRQPTVIKYVGYLSPMFMAAFEDEIIDCNPFFRLRVPESRAFDTVEAGGFFAGGSASDARGALARIQEHSALLSVAGRLG